MIEVKPNQQVYNTSCPDTLAVLPDKRVRIISVEHGSIDQQFPGRIQARTLLNDFYTTHSLRGIVADSLSDLEFVADYYGINIAMNRNVPEDQLSFHQWVVRYAFENKLWIIGADLYKAFDPSPTEIFIQENNKFHSDSPYYNKLVQRVLQSSSYKQVESEYNAAQTQIQLINDIRKPTIALLLYTGMLLLQSQEKMNRRSFFSNVVKGTEAVVGVGIVAGTDSLLKGLMSIFDRRNRQRLLDEENSILVRNGLPPLAGFSSWEISYQARQNDEDIIDKLYRTRQPLDQQSCLSPSVERYGQALEGESPFSLIVRNALIAEALSLPSKTIMPGVTDRIVDVVGLMGFDHLVIKNYTVTELIKNPQLRRQVIKTLIPALLLAAQSGAYPEVDPVAVKDHLLQLGRSYIFNEDGSVQTHSFSIPFVKNVVEKSRL